MHCAPAVTWTSSVKPSRLVLQALIEAEAAQQIGAGRYERSAGLVDGLGGLGNAVAHVCGLECVQDLQQCRLVKGHRALCLFASTIGVVSLNHRTVATPMWQLRHRGAATYTPQWDAASW
jgi:ClpP class serine protease